MTTQNVTIPALSRGSFSAYLAAPSTQPRAGIVLIQEVLGVNNAHCDRPGNQDYSDSTQTGQRFSDHLAGFYTYL